MNELTDFLSRIPACRGMSGLEVSALSAFLEQRNLSADEILFHEGEPGAEMYILRSGVMATYVTEADSSRREVYEFAPGQLFGEMAIAENSVRSATAYAKTDACLLVLEALDFHRLVWEHPGLAVKLLANMAANLASWLDEAASYLGDLARWGESARRKAVLDETTGLFNRRFLGETLRSRFSRRVDLERCCALLSLDLDHFHRVNESYGPRAGDAVIAQVGARLSGLVAESWGEGTVAARLSGDEFSIFMPDASAGECARFAGELREAIEQLHLEFRLPGRAEPDRLSITVSIGYATAPHDAIDAASLVEAADRALMAAKEGGRNRVEGSLEA
jgi:diguanylate cyclase (GGDEF)-like protein